MQHALGILQRSELALMSGNRDLLGAQLRLLLLQAGLQVRLFAQQSSLAAAGFIYLFLKLRQVRLQLADLILAPKDRRRRFDSSIAGASGINAVTAQQLSAQRD